MRNIYYSKVLKNDGTWSYEVSTVRPYEEIMVVDENAELVAAMVDIMLECESIRLNESYDFAIQAELVRILTTMKQDIELVTIRLLGPRREDFITQYSEKYADFMMVATTEYFEVEEARNKIKGLMEDYENDNLPK